MSFRLVSIIPCLSLMLSSVVFSVFLNITLYILLVCRFRVFLCFEITLFLLKWKNIQILGGFSH
jgi:hypothetical protein